MASEDIAAFIADFRGAVRTVSRSCDRECHLDAPGRILGRFWKNALFQNIEWISMGHRFMINVY
jgi:hypothetical protein